MQLVIPTYFGMFRGWLNALIDRRLTNLIKPSLCTLASFSPNFAQLFALMEGSHFFSAISKFTSLNILRTRGCCFCVIRQYSLFARDCDSVSFVQASSNVPSSLSSRLSTYYVYRRIQFDSIF